MARLLNGDGRNTAVKVEKVQHVSKVVNTVEKSFRKNKTWIAISKVLGKIDKNYVRVVIWLDLVVENSMVSLEKWRC